MSHLDALGVPAQVCRRCVMDTTDPEIKFDDQGICNHCTAAIERLKVQIPEPEIREQQLRILVDRIKEDGKDKDHDCILGVSGGVDSTAVLFHAKRLGLCPLAVHFDNGWNSELAVDNIARSLELLNVDLITYVVDWEEFRDLQLAFLKAGVANCEAPTDHGITALLFQTAKDHGLRYILSGSNLATESIMPNAWGHYNQDLRFLRAIHERFGKSPLRTMPTIGIGQYLYYVLGKKIRQIPFLNYVDYEKNKAKALLLNELGWRDYGGKHYESVWTRFFQGYYLPTKFGFDKRKAHLSSQIASNQISRAQALEELRQPIYEEGLLRQDKEFVAKKFGLTPESFEKIIRAPPYTTDHYPNHHLLFHRLRVFKNIFRKIATSA